VWTMQAWGSMHSIISVQCMPCKSKQLCATVENRRVCEQFTCPHIKQTEFKETVSIFKQTLPGGRVVCRQWLILQSYNTAQFVWYSKIRTKYHTACYTNTPYDPSLFFCMFDRTLPGGRVVWWQWQWIQRPQLNARFRYAHFIFHGKMHTQWINAIQCFC
jgi:hypothetical protein